MRSEPNPFVGRNYLNLNARMAVPPTYWLQRLYDFDDMLVVFPSFKVPFAYVLARRRQLTAGLTDVVTQVAAELVNPDTVACLNHGLVPVSLIYRTGEAWHIDNILQSLRARDIWAHGGADKFADKLDEADNARERQTHAAVRDDMYNRAGDAWRSYQARTGQRNHR